ncbi:hypothetical protein DFH07DRAFT_1014728, partial [Mycena maculata]
SARSASVDTASSIRGSSLNTSSGSLSLFPGYPKIFHARESELHDLVAMLTGDTARVAILGPGVMGKPTLAVAALHHPAIIEKYTTRYLVSCESAMTSVDLMAIIGSHLELSHSRLFSKNIIRYFSRCGPCLLVLDNFETPWEPWEFRGDVEEFISSLADIASLALLITMCGAERPRKVKWSRPFLAALEPILFSAACQILVDVADEPVVEEELALVGLLDLSGNLLLAVSLMANIVSFEGYSSTLSRWELEITTLLSDGHNKDSNLEKSITLSLGSPRLLSDPHAKVLLSLLSLLPDGI